MQAVSRGIALNMVQKWLGHAQLTTTAIYANAVDEEEQNIAARTWWGLIPRYRLCGRLQKSRSCEPSGPVLADGR